MTDSTSGPEAPSAVLTVAEHEEHVSADAAPELFEHGTDGERL
ncbi:hypothetical protein ACFQDD_05900 [Halorubrum pallidum]|uniref:Uncharacterized protein n=1 Tax=Halorubrum pallidum TaxID=1526114 RepID=A0ABD5T4F1_9EURY